MARKPAATATASVTCVLISAFFAWLTHLISRPRAHVMTQLHDRTRAGRPPVPGQAARRVPVTSGTGLKSAASQTSAYGRRPVVEAADRHPSWPPLGTAGPVSRIRAEPDAG